MTAHPTPLLTEMTASATAVALEYFEAGRAEGWVAGYAAAVRDRDALHAQGRAVAQWVARRPSYADLCEMRGEPERAALQRDLLTARGIA